MGQQPRLLRVGIGDDAAVWKTRRSHLSLVSTDALVDEVHFRLGATSAGALGHKALAVNFSDIAAMGGSPTLAVVALGVTDRVDETWVRTFYHGMGTLAKRYGCAIAGGDIVRAPALFIAVTVIGEVRKSNLRLRCTAKAGDFACVTGALGLSAAALKAGVAADLQVRSARIDPVDAALLRAAYETPTPRVPEGKFLGASRSTHAMMDISDGLSLDAWRMASASKLDVCLDVDALRRHCPKALASLDNSLELMLYGGDDYELLAAVDPRAYQHIARRFKARFGRELWVAGHFEQGDGKVWTLEDGNRREHAPRGYDHLNRADDLA